MKSKFTIKIQNEQEFETALKWLRDNSTTSKDGKWQIEVSYEHMAAEELLFNNLIVKPDLPELTLRRVFKLSVNRWWKAKTYRDANNSTQGFKKAFSIELNRIEKHHFQVLGFFNADVAQLGKRQIFEINQVKLKFIKWFDLRKFDTSALWEHIGAYSFNLPSGKNPVGFYKDKTFIPHVTVFQPFIADVEAYDSHEATEMVSKSYALFRSFLNIPATAGTIRFGTPGPYSKYLPSPIWGVFNSKGKFDTFYYNPLLYSYARQSIDATNKSNFSWFYSKLRTNKNTAVEQVQNLSLLYQKAIDKVDEESLYLGLWQVIENGAMKEREQPHNKIIDRTINFLYLKDELFRRIPYILAHKRHELVHKNEFPESSRNHITILKLLAAHTIIQLTNEVKYVKNKEELKDLIRLTGSDTRNLKENRQLINHILRQRRNNKP